MKLFFAFFLIVYIRPAMTADRIDGCLDKSSLGLARDNESLVGCNAASIALQNDSEGVKSYKAKLYAELAKSVAKQTKQILQDLGSSSDFYEKNDQSFLMGESSPEVAKKCKFDFIKTIEENGCNGVSTVEEKEKLKMIADSLENNFRPKTLMEGLQYVYGSNKYGAGFDDPSMNQCPVSGSAFALNSQITNFNASLLIKEFQAADNDFKLDTLFSKYPLLRMVKESKAFDPGFQEKFIKYIKAYSSGSNAEKYISDFFFEEENKKALSRGVARRCEQVRASISSFVCHPLQEVASFDPATSRTLFNNYNPSREFQDQKAFVKKDPDAFKTYAFLCQAQSQAKNNGLFSGLAGSEAPDCLKLKSQDDTVDNWYRCFNEGVTKDQTSDDTLNISNFCDRFSCKDPIVKNAPSCKMGGPLSSTDLAGLNLVDENTFNQIAYLQKLERHAKTRARFQFGNMATPVGGALTSGENNSSLSAFDLNAFGADAVMKFVKIPATPLAIALVNQDLKNKGINSSTPEEIKQVINRSDFLSDKIASKPSVNFDDAISSSNYQTNAARDNNSWKRPAVDFGNGHDTKVSKVNNPLAEPKKENSDEEVKQMVSDLEQIMKDQKKDTESNKKIESKIASTEFADVNKINSPFDSWAKSLKSKESALDERENIANIRDAEYWRRENELSSRENELAAKSSRLNDGTIGKTQKQTARAADQMNLENEIKANASSSGLIVTPDKLDKLEKIDLKNFGVNIEEPFVISIKMNGKLIHVRVAKVEVKGKTFLAPRLNEDNLEVKEAILKSPLFKEFRYFYEKENSAYFPTSYSRKS